LPLPGIGVGTVAQFGQRHGDDMNVVAKLVWRQWFGRVVEQIAAGLEFGDILVPGLWVHGHQKIDAAAPSEPAAARDAYLVPRRQALDIRREDVSRADGHAHAQDGFGEQRIGRG